MDYRGIEALHTVIDEQSFEKAAQVLHITQSAVSQRIKTLETQYGQPVLIRVVPYRPTQLGEYLLGHFKQVRLLEDQLQQKISPEQGRAKLSLALNRDSLETWFLDLVETSNLLCDVELEILADDQERTIEYLQKGQVSACLSTTQKEIIGGTSNYLGTMDYLLVASPAFVANHFKGELTAEALIQAPCLRFDQNDYLHHRYLEQFFDVKDAALHCHTIPSVRGFKVYVMGGHGYALIPRVDIEAELSAGQLVHLCPEKVWKDPLYWHHWTIQSDAYQRFNRQIIQLARTKLQPDV